jgi:hypothetical protein
MTRRLRIVLMIEAVEARPQSDHNDRLLLRLVRAYRAEVGASYGVKA